MEGSAVPIICYFGGNLSSTNAAEYIGGRSTASFITKSITLSELHTKAKSSCGMSHDTLIKLKCRYPLNHSMAIAIDICDDSSLAVVMASIPTLSSSLVLYLEEVPKQQQQSLTISNIEDVNKRVKSTERVPCSIVEGVDKDLTVASPSESRVPRTPQRMGRGRDIGWLHCTPVGEGTSKTQCNYCGKIMSGGGITRMKQHLAGGSDVESCTKCGMEVKRLFRDLIRKKQQARSNKRIKEQQQRYSEVSVLPDCFEDQDCFEQEAVKEGSPVIHSQFSGGASSSRAHDEMLPMVADSED